MWFIKKYYINFKKTNKKIRYCRNMYESNKLDRN